MTDPFETAEKLERIVALVGKDKAPTLAELARYDLQRDLAKTGEAAGQCPGCGSYRLDGLPPVLHERGCAWGARLCG
jgi:hypothetical protein